VAQAQSRQALDDVRVLEVTGWQGQLCGKLLAGMGADVIKAEPPAGSPVRYCGPFYLDSPDANGSLAFWHYNVGKRGVTLSLDAPEGQRLFRNLARVADVVLESTPPGWMAARGLGHEVLRRANPRLIWCAATPYGQTGPWRAHTVSELALMASGGQMALCGYDAADDSNDTPIAPGGGNAWHIADNYACIAILLALYNRDARGVGEFIDCSAQDAIALCDEGAFPDYVSRGKDRQRQTGRHANLAGSPPVQFRCKDGRYANCFLTGLKPEQFLRLVEWLDEYDLAGEFKDDKYLDSEELRPKMPELMATVGRLCARLTPEEVFHGGQGRNLAWTAVRAPSELLDDAHLHERGFFVEVEHPELRRSFTYPGAPFVMRGTPWRFRRRAPLLGEDNVAVFHRELGVSLERLNALAETGVI
jgi:crotonobetainyl-CoA:carnitine CoA-transferase CaiB-like acyl-CoA transferase